MIKTRNKVFKRKKRQPNNENCKRLYNLLRNRIKWDLKKSKKQYYEQYFTEHVNNIKKTWDGIKKIVNLKKNSNRTSQLNVGGKVIDDKEILLMLNLIRRGQFQKFLIYHLLNF